MHGGGVEVVTVRTKLVVAAVALAAALVVPAVPAGALDVDELLDDPAMAHDPAVLRLVRLDRRVEALLRRSAVLEREVGRAALAYVDAAHRSDVADAAAAEAEAAVEERVRTAYQLGPGATLEALLSAETFPDLAAITEYTARTVELDERALCDAARAKVVADSARAFAEAELAAVALRLEELRRTLAEAQAHLDRAEGLAEEARLEHLAFEAEQRAIAEAAARATTWEDLRTLTYGEDQTPYLALLGPTGGRTCETPPGLVETGESFSGYASWYGWEFGGQSTAMGSVFDPRLFTAANRWLPMGTFLRVRNGERCAIVLVNDRGPYGRLERVIDLSMAAAQYLGVGVTWVDAEILVVAPPA